MNKNSKKKQLTGIVISNSMEKTVVVESSRKFPHPKYKKYIKRTKKYYAHDPQNNCKKGDRVLILESKPISKLKRWIVLEIEKKAVN